MTGGFVLRRVWLLALCALAAGAAAYLLTPPQEPREARVATFVLHPNPQVDAAIIPDALRATGGTDSQLTRTVTGVLASTRFLEAALGDGADRALRQDGYRLRASVQPGTDVIRVDISAREGVRLDRLVPGYARAARAWVQSMYKVYNLEFLDAATARPTDSGGMRALQATALAALAGLLVGLLLVFMEARYRARAEPAAVTWSGEGGSDGGLAFEAPKSQGEGEASDSQRDRATDRIAQNR